MSEKILKFSATWCAPCQQMKKMLEGVDLGVEVEEIDIDESRDQLSDYGVRSIPTLVYLRDGVEIGRINGMQTLNEIKDWIDSL